VVEAEGPVHVALAARRVAGAWGLTRAGSRVRERVIEAATLLAARGEIERRDDFLRLPGAAVVPRRPTDEAWRAIDEIDPEELAAAVEAIARACFSAPREALLRESARALGFSRPNARVFDALDAAVASLLLRGALRPEGDRIAVGGS
jgi:hypothetical protein